MLCLFICETSVKTSNLILNTDQLGWGEDALTISQHKENWETRTLSTKNSIFILSFASFQEPSGDQNTVFFYPHNSVRWSTALVTTSLILQCWKTEQLRQVLAFLLKSTPVCNIQGFWNQGISLEVMAALCLIYTLPSCLPAFLLQMWLGLLCILTPDDFIPFSPRLPGS